jgi:hypothetical protein
MNSRNSVLIVSWISMMLLLGACCGLLKCNEKDLLAEGLTGLQQIDGQPDKWKFENGILYTEGDGGGWLSTTQQYSDFRLELEFRVPPGGNSGVFLRAPHKGDPAYEGMEIQVLDDYAPEYADLRPTQYTGSIYDVEPPAEQVSKKANQWQKMAIQCVGQNVQVELNGTKIISANLNEYRDKLDKHPGLARTEGYIGLQNHGSRIEYRNIKIRILN